MNPTQTQSYGHLQRCVVGSKEGDTLRDLLRRAEAFERHTRQDAGRNSIQRFFVHAHLAEDRRRDRAGTDDVDADATACEFDGQSLRQAVERGFAGGVDACAGHAEVNRHRRGQHDGRPVRHQGQRAVDGEVSPLEIDVRNLIEHGFGRVADGQEFANARVDEEDVHATNLLPDLGESAVEIGHAPDIGRHAQRVAADFHGRLRDGFRVAPDDDDPRAELFKFLRGGEADAAVAAGDDSDLVFEFHVSVQFGGGGWVAKLERCQFRRTGQGAPSGICGPIRQSSRH